MKNNPSQPEPLEHKIAHEAARVIIAAILLPHVLEATNECNAVHALQKADALLHCSELPKLLTQLRKKETQ